MERRLDPGPRDDGVGYLLMGELSADEQVILTLAEIEGRTSPEISKLTGKAAGTIRVTLHRAKQKLADALFNRQEAYEKRT